MTSSQIADAVPWRNQFQLRQRRQKQMKTLKKAAPFLICLAIGFLIGRI